MTRRTMLASSTLVGLSGVYGLYAAIVNPLIQPPIPSAPVGQRPVTPPPRNSVLVAEQYLSAAPWAAEAQYQLRTKEAFVYFENWKRVDEHSAVRFWPFAIVWIHNDRALEEGPVTFVSDSAMVKFARKFEITNDPGRVIAAALEGDTVVGGPNNLDVRGRNFTYSESAMRMWSDEPLTFAYGENSGRSTGMQVDLVAQKDLDDNSLAVAGMRAVHLKRDVVMNLVSEGDPNAPETTKPTKPTHAKVTSDGSFTYDVETMVALFRENVRLERPTSPETLDLLETDVLEITFASAVSSAAEVERPPPQTPPTPETGRFRGFETDLTFRKMHASGATVRLHSAEHDVTAFMTELDYDTESRVVEFRHEDRVRVLHEGSELWSPQITLVHAREGGDLESVLCLGNGQMRHVDPDSGRVDLEAKWGERMQIRPDDESNLQMLELESDAVVRQVAEGSAMQANYIRLWFDRDEKRTGAGGDETTASASAIEPRKLLALEDVVMVADRMVATTKRLEAWFDPAETSADRRPVRTSSSAPLRDGHWSQSLAAVDDESATLRTARKPELLANDDADGPIEFSADLVRIRAVRSEAGPDDTNARLEVREVWSFGNVDVRQQHGDGEPPLQVTGRQLHVVAGQPNEEVIHVYGVAATADTAAVPAHVRDRGVHMEGPAIHLDRGENRAWVDGGGLLQLPVKQNADGTTLDKPQLLDVWWEDRMVFDGLTATFVGNVKTVLQADRIHCSEMNVKLTERIDFSQSREEGRSGGREDGERVQLARVVCRDGVRLDGRAYEGSKLVGVRQAEFWQFELDQITGDTLAKGPGWLVLWRRGGGRGTDLDTPAVVRTNARAAAEQTDWEYTRIEFDGQTEGNVNDRTTRFDGLVEITYGPVAKPLDVVDPDALPENGGWMRSESLDLQQVEKTESRPAYFTAFGEGNVYLRGREFFARADEVAYDESKDRYVLRSKGTRNATIWREKPGGGYDVAPAKRMEFVPSRNVLKLDRASALDASN